MSAPTPAPGDDRPREGYYPDPSIPGYVRYWNGAAWVPGTSRPAPSDGEPLPPPPGVTRAPAPAQIPAPAPSPVLPSAEETGPFFLDEEPGAPRATPGDAQHGTKPEPASAWGADTSQQTGFGGDQDRRISWGSQQPAGPHTPRPSQEQESAEGVGGTPGTMRMRALKPGPAAGSAAAAGGDAGPGGTPEPPTDGTVKFRRPAVPGRPVGAGAGSAAKPADSASGAGSGQNAGAAAPGTDGTMAIRALTGPAGERGAGQAASTPAPASPQPSAPQPSAPRPATPQLSASPQASAPATQHSVPRQGAATGTPAVQQQPGPPGPSPVTSGPGGGQPSWAQQVHRLAQPESGPAASAAGGEQPVAPWKPPVEDPFLAAAQAQASARPAGLGKRFAARLIDTFVTGAVTAAVAVPLLGKAIDHIDAKIDAAKLSGETVTVWLIDGTTAGYLGIVLGVLLLFGVAYEALPTAKWGRTLGKKLCGLEVRDIEAHEPPSFGAALRRWLVYCVPGVLVIGVVGVLWCLFDRPWRQCWHDKAARTFVAG
ncbi:RDD family protein [Streptomyces himalayensis]|uniref:RDD family protein n=1 Tax=Streptomyces himalayensis subsp. himalayensis TaxID=2756131 RepID=A0A7W0IBS1_9ACTN|nr:RDD family protein [Streptomyces himalayensis]MBA2949444.1 RDD family protein [Streptomyces himalayensis subsp. himalayensis]